MANFETDYTGVREYVGARYVPVFADPVEWSTDRAYEPLTMVQDSTGNTWVSKQAVPTGIQLDNGQYWVLFSVFSQQVETYRQEVEAIASQITNVSQQANTALTQANRFANTTDLGNYSDFKYALRAPVSFNTALFMEAAEKQWNWFKTNNWEYLHDRDATTIPLMNLETGETLNAAGKVTSCSPAVVSVLYWAGYQELAGTSHYFTNTNYMRDFLLGKGWTLITNQGDIQRGDIVLQGWHTDAEADDTATHVFIAASNVTKYDVGTGQLTAGHPVNISWNILRPNINRAYDNGLYRFDASRYLHAPSETDNQPWKMIVSDEGDLMQLLFSKSQIVVRSKEGETFEQRSVDLGFRQPVSVYASTNKHYDDYMTFDRMSYYKVPDIDTSIQPYTVLEDGIAINQSGMYLISANVVWQSTASANTSQVIASLVHYVSSESQVRIVTGKAKSSPYGSFSISKIVGVVASSDNPYIVKLKNISIDDSTVIFEGGMDRTFIQIRSLA